MKKLINFLAVSIVLSVMICCSNDNSNGSSTVVFKATLNGANERPTPTNSTATGSATLTYNTSSKMIVMTVTYSGLTPISGHIHKGAADVAGPVVFPFTSLTSPIYFTSPRALTTEEEADLMGNLYYVNLHTTANPDGEIRGQLIKQTSGGGGYNNGGGYGY